MRCRFRPASHWTITVEVEDTPSDAA
ncbi:UNVERIFIED_CONTAM: hypothetical protein GTU68_057690 [Idotea baltica]|nr:hypothetical protein [Idotea baltica]